MADITSPSKRDLDAFRAIVEELTGFENTAMDLLEANLAVLKCVLNTGNNIEEFIQNWGPASHKNAPSICSQCFETACQIVYLFYLGSIRVSNRWKRCGWPQHEHGLVWSAIGVHPPMTRGRGVYGDWAEMPITGSDHDRCEQL